MVVNGKIENPGAAAPPRPPAVVETSVASGGLAIGREIFPHNLTHRLSIVRGQDGRAYSVSKDAGNLYALPVGSKQLNNIIRAEALANGLTLTTKAIGEVNGLLQAAAETEASQKKVWNRYAQVEGGLEIDLGDRTHKRVRISSGKVEVVTEGSETLFFRTPSSKPLVAPAKIGDRKLLAKYLANMHTLEQHLFIAWLTYTIAHPKVPTTKYPILVLNGNQGSGKSFLCTNVISRIIDPSAVPLRVLPRNDKDLAIATQGAHVVCFDNVRELKQDMADKLCIAATGGAISARKLYTDEDEHVITLHAAVVLNGIHSFIDQPDLAQRCLPIELRPIPEACRLSEEQLAADLEADLPTIVRGLYDLTAEIFKHLPTAQVTNPERMIDFVKWLAAMEVVDGFDAGDYQAAYSYVLNQGQLNSLMEHPLAAAVVDFSQGLSNGEWSGTPAQLLAKLNTLVSPGTQRNRDWPQNAIALSKRLLSLQGGLLSQDIHVELTRGKERTVTIVTRGGQHF